MLRPIHEVYRYHLQVRGNPQLVDLVMFDEDLREVIMLVKRNIPRKIGMEMLVVLNLPILPAKK